MILLLINVVIIALVIGQQFDNVWNAVRCQDMYMNTQSIVHPHALSFRVSELINKAHKS